MHPRPTRVDYHTVRTQKAAKVWLSPLPFTKGRRLSPTQITGQGAFGPGRSSILESRSPALTLVPHSPYALRGSPPWGHHLPSDCCPIYLRWPTGPLWGSFWSTRTLTNTRRGGNLGSRMRCTPPVADTLEVSPRILLNPVAFPDANLHRAPKKGNQMMTCTLLIVSTCH